MTNLPDPNTLGEPEHAPDVRIDPIAYVADYLGLPPEILRYVLPEAINRPVTVWLRLSRPIQGLVLPVPGRHEPVVYTQTYDRLLLWATWGTGGLRMFGVMPFIDPLTSKGFAPYTTPEICATVDDQSGRRDITITDRTVLKGQVQEVEQDADPLVRYSATQGQKGNFEAGVGEPMRSALFGNQFVLAERYQGLPDEPNVDF